MGPSATVLLNRFTVRAKFRHMQVLVKLAELGSMHRTAEAVHMTQPAISQLVAELESLMETQLFFRHARGVEPTAATRDLLPIAHRILGALEDGAETVANRLHEQGGIVRVSASPAALGGMIHGRMDRFATKNPEIQVHITQSHDADPLGGVADGSVDIICTREPSVIPEGWIFERCLDDELIAVCGRTHPFATGAVISSEALGEALWLLNRVGSVARNRFEEISERHDWPRSTRCPIIMHIPELTRDMLVTGKYLAILPRSVSLPWQATGEVIELNTEINAPLPPLGFLRERDRAGKATLAFAQHLQSRSGIC